LFALCDQGRDPRNIEVIRDIFDEGGTALRALSPTVAPGAGFSERRARLLLGCRPAENAAENIRPLCTRGR
jgi:hypothetical protein